MLDDLTKDYHTLIHFTPTVKERNAFAKRGVAMPDGSFYIRNGSDLDNAIKAVGRATPTNNETETTRRNAVRRHIIQRANQMGLSSKIPDTWNSNGSLKQSGLVADVADVLAHVSRKSREDGIFEQVLAHFGRKGMKWGAHVFGRDRGTSSSSAHPDAVKAHEALNIARKHGTSALSTHELRNLNNRLQQERQFSQLTAAHKSEGRKFIEEYAKQTAKQELPKLAAKYGPKGAAWIAKNVIGAGKHAK